jgi:pyruvate,orthophosphate dikinase
VLEWADAARVLGVRANADSPEDAERARGFGAQGIGLCRTEHMFLGERQPLMADVILAEDREARMRCLEVLRPLQQADFEGVFEAMTGLPVTIRLLDPPLHEFLPHKADVEKLVERARIEVSDDLERLERMYERVKALEETNPMLGTRGVRLGILYPEIYRMQADAIFAAARAVRERSGVAPHLEVMVPLVDYERELELMRALVLECAAKAGLAQGEDFLIGTMIELPRACFQADAIASSPTSSRSGPTTSPRRRSGSPATTSRARSSRATSRRRSSTAPRSRRSTRPGWGRCCGWARGWDARRRAA